MICKFENAFLFLVLFLCFAVVLSQEPEEEIENVVSNKEVEEVVVREKEMSGESIRFRIEPITTNDQNGLIIEPLAENGSGNNGSNGNGKKDVSGNGDKAEDRNKKDDEDEEKEEDDEKDKGKKFSPPLFEKKIGIRIDKQIGVSTGGLGDLIGLAQSLLAWKARLFATLFSSISPCLKKPCDDEKNGKNGKNGKNAKNDKNGKDEKSGNGKGENGTGNGEESPSRRLKETEEENTNNDLSGMQAHFDIGLARGKANLGLGTLESFIEKLNELVNASVQGPEAFRKKFNEFFGTNINFGNDVEEDNDAKVEEDQINALRETVLSSLHQDFQFLRLLLPPVENDE